MFAPLYGYLGWRPGEWEAAAAAVLPEDSGELAAGADADRGSNTSALYPADAEDGEGAALADSITELKHSCSEDINSVNRQSHFFFHPPGGSFFSTL